MQSGLIVSRNLREAVARLPASPPSGRACKFPFARFFSRKVTLHLRLVQCRCCH